MSGPRKKAGTQEHDAKPMRKVAARKRAPKPAPAIAILVEEPLWRKDADALRLMRRAVRLAAVSPPHPDICLGAGSGEVTILLTNDARMRGLNAQFRGKNRAANVLAFPPSEDDGSFGDLALGLGRVRAEAARQGKRFCDHAAHLAAHGALHLLGYEHENAKERSYMEGLETAILARLGIADPYAPRRYTRGRKALHL